MDENFFVTICSARNLIVWSMHRKKDKFILKPLKQIDFLSISEKGIEFTTDLPLLSGQTSDGYLFALNYLNKKVFCFSPTPSDDLVLGLRFLENPFGFFVYWTAANEVGCVSQTGVILSRMSSESKIRKTVFWQDRKGFYKVGLIWDKSKIVSVYSLPFFEPKEKLKSWFEVRDAVTDSRTQRILLIGETSLQLIISE